MSKVIVLATPVFLLLIALEYAWGLARMRKGAGQNTYALGDTLNSVSLGILSQLSGALSKLFNVGIYTLVFGAVALWDTASFWTSWYGALLALIFYDLCYYALHRAGHEVAVLWASHAVHHQSQHYNLSTALRQTSSGAFLGWIFYLPMALAGVPPDVFAIVALVDLLYQFWVHTEQIGKLGWFDHVFCSPSNHRVHHAINAPYLDKNYGGILVIWDRLFGSFAVEQEKCVYGTRDPLRSWDPLWANLTVYAALAHDAWHTRHWADKVRVWLKPPGWQPADLALARPKPVFRLEGISHYQPPLSRGQQAFAIVQFGVLLSAVAALLWHVDAMPLTEAAIWCAALAVAVWALGRFLQGSLHPLEVLAVQTAALAVLSALGWLPGFVFLKPLVLVFTILFVAKNALSTWATGRFGTYLLLALAFSILGDIALLWPDTQFVLGLGLFLVAHVFYILLLRQGQAWLLRRTVLVVLLAMGAGVYAILWPSLHHPVLKWAVAAYMGIIVLMAAQAVGRAAVLGDNASRGVAVGACVFLLSDTLLAIHQFVTPLPMAPMWILATYYSAQLLIVHHARPPLNTT